MAARRRFVWRARKPLGGLRGISRRLVEIRFAYTTGRASGRRVLSLPSTLSLHGSDLHVFDPRPDDSTDRGSSQPAASVRRARQNKLSLFHSVLPIPSDDRSFRWVTINLDGKQARIDHPLHSTKYCTSLQSNLAKCVTDSRMLGPGVPEGTMVLALRDGASYCVVW